MVEHPHTPENNAPIPMLIVEELEEVELELHLELELELLVESPNMLWTP